MSTRPTPPEGYTKLTEAPCKCARLWTDGVDYYCCGGGFEKQRTDPLPGLASNVVAMPEPEREPTDKEVADDVRARLKPHLEAIAAIMNEADRDGMQVTVQIPRDGFGRFTAVPAVVVKVL